MTSSPFTVAIACRHCGVVRSWTVGKDGKPRSAQPATCDVRTAAVVTLPGQLPIELVCEPAPESSGDRMTRELARGARNRLTFGKRKRR